jgi:carboxyl-terminal processing protease
VQGLVVPPDAKNDKALHLAVDLIRGTQTNPAFPPKPSQAAAN